MSERAGFIAAIIEQPEDDTARLAFADWLDEHGEPERAEFVRVQVEYARIGPEKPTVDLVNRAINLTSRADELLTDANVALWFPGDIWAGYVLNLAAPKSFSPEDAPFATISRGFVSAITCTQADFLQHAASIFAAHPVTDVRLSDWPPAEVGDIGYAITAGQSDGRRLPAEIVRQLYRGPVPIVHRSREGASAALSNACVNWGRALKPGAVMCS
jgi:uncharacterized protein (TIGR02996 family)